MDNIIFFKEKDKNGFEEPFVKIERNYLLTIKKYVGANFRGQEISKMIRENNDDYITLNISYFKEIVEAMILQADLRTNADFFDTVAEQYGESYSSALTNYFAERGNVNRSEVVGDRSRSRLARSVVYKAIDNDLEPLKKCIDTTSSLLDITQKIYKQRDLKTAKTSVLESLKYIVSPIELINYENRFNEMLEEKPVDLEKIEQYLKLLQQIILEDWQKGVSSINDYKPGDPFRFICHSTNSKHIEGDFFSNLVSCSLLTEEFTDTYRSGFGFILGPDAIVGADGADMYVDNYVDDESDMLRYSTISKIASIGKILDQCRFAQKKNKENNKQSKVYSEVVIKGFKPIGLFCLTIGDKSFNRNYRSAKKFQEQYPELPLIEIDLTYYKDKERLVYNRNDLLYNIEREINANAERRDSEYYDLYDYFWQNYLEMKKSKDYREADIVSLYRENSELISWYTTADKLFSGKYSVQAIEYAIMNNPLYNLKRILSDRVTPYDIKKISDELINYADNELLTTAIPGLGHLLKVIDRVKMEDIDIKVILETKPITIESITRILQDELTKESQILSDEISSLKDKRAILMGSYIAKEKELETNSEYKKIIDFEYLYHMAHSEYKWKHDNLLDTQKYKSDIETKQKDTSNEYTKLQEEKHKLSKHRIFNLFKIRKLNLEMREIKAKLDSLNFNIRAEDKSIQELNARLAEIRTKFKKNSGFELLEYGAILERAREQYSVTLKVIVPYDLERIQRQIDEIDLKLENLLKNQQQIDEINIHRK